MTEENAIRVDAQAGSQTDTAILLHFLKDRDIPCPICAYNLRNLTASRCPECGRELKLAVGATEPYLVPWILTLIAASMTASFGVLCVVAIPFSAGEILHGPPVACGMMLYAVAAIPVTIGLSTKRRNFWRMAPQKQRKVARISIVCTVAFFIILLFGPFI